MLKNIQGQWNKVSSSAGKTPEAIFQKLPITFFFNLPNAQFENVFKQSDLVLNH